MRPTKTRNTGSAFLSWKLTGYAEVIPGDPIRAITCRVEMWRGGLGAAYLLPALSSAGASIASPCFRFHIPLIEPDGPVSGIRLSEKGSRCRPREIARPLGKADEAQHFVQ